MELTNFYTHDHNGRITRTFQDTEDFFEVNRYTLRLCRGTANPRKHYVTEQGLEDRPLQHTYLDGNTLKDVPQPCEIVINGRIYSCDDPDVELEFDQPGSYRVTVVSWPYLDKEVTIET